MHTRSVVVVFPVYVVAGCGWNHYKARQSGEGSEVGGFKGFVDKCPNKDFWWMIPGLVKVGAARRTAGWASSFFVLKRVCPAPQDGCIFTYRGIRSLIERMRGGGQGYESTA
jgi:hypothetical protein